ncbi:MAG: helix-turn-helix transcriptional regulator [Akkermansiaceae bacterium]|nr:helix-turn-helix transcriptional regulator [Verrucomicrobiales bacterium]
MKTTPDPLRRSSGPPEFFSSHVAEARRFYLNLAPSQDATLAVVCGGRESCTPDYAIHRSGFPYYSFEFVVQGRGTVKLKGLEESLHAGKVFCYGPGTRQDIVTDPAEPLVKYFVNFAGTRARRLLQTCGMKPGSTAQVVAPGDLEVVFDEIIHNGLRATRYSPEICSKLLECLALKTAELSAPSEGVESPAFVTYQKCRQHIQENFERLRTLDQIARECHVNGAYLCRLFRRFGHQSPYQFLMRQKMNLAAERLHEPGMLIKQVAEETGFSDPFHFSRAFKSVFGLSPDAFRKLH